MNIPEGFKLVPVELLESLLDDPALVVRMSSDKIMAIKSALLAAASTPPQPIYDDSSIRGWEVGSRLFRQRLEAHKYITSGQSYVDGNGSKLEPLYRATAGEVGHE